MKTMDDSAIFEEKGYRLDALIMTSFTEFDALRIKRYLRKANSLLRFDFSRMWLFQCNPVTPSTTAESAQNEKQDDANALLSKCLYSRVFAPICRKNGNSIKCKGCLSKCLNENNGIPEKVFHPKVWLLRFIKQDKTNDFFWKLVVSSKNMSKGAEKLLDCYFFTNGKTDPSISKQTNDLIQFLEDLKSDNEEYESLVKEIGKLKWEQKPEFLYVNGEEWSIIKKRLPWSNKKVEEMKVLSPFLNTGFVDYLFKEVCSDTKIYSDAQGFSSLELKKFTKNQKNMFVQKFGVADKDTPWHAKIYVWKVDGKWYMLLGSLNATIKAFSDNTEFGVWFEIDETQLPDWSGNTPELSDNCVDKDESSDRKIDDAFDEEKVHETVSSMEQQILREALRNQMFDEAQKELIRCTGVEKEDADKCDFESIILCGKCKNTNILKDLSNINAKYGELSSDEVWRRYFEGCCDLIETVKEIEDAGN